jgi:hypothetical protein
MVEHKSSKTVNEPRPSDERNGCYLDKMWSCKVCDGEIPDGHTDDCDIWKLEKKHRDFIANKYNAVLTERDRLRAELDARSAHETEALRDAERYRWLRKGNDYQHEGPMLVLCEQEHIESDERPFWVLSEAALDTAVDAARGSSVEPPPPAETSRDDARDAARYRKLRNADPDAGPCVTEEQQNDWGNWNSVHLGGKELDQRVDGMAELPPEEPRETTAPKSKFDLAFEIMRQLDAERVDTMQSCHFGYVLRVERERSPEEPKARYLRPWVGTASMYAGEHKLAVSDQWCQGWNACLDALDARGCETEPVETSAPLNHAPGCGVHDGKPCGCVKKAIGACICARKDGRIVETHLVCPVHRPVKATAKVVPSICGKPMPDGKGAGQCINVPGHEGECDDMPF